MSIWANSYRRNVLGLTLLIVVLCGAGVAVHNAYYLTILILCMIFGIGSIGLTIAMGYAGLISLGQSAFFGIGAYVAAGLATKEGLEPAAALLVGGCAAGVVGWLIARPLLRLSDLYFAMASLAFGIVAYIVFGQWRSLTGGLDPGFSSAPFAILGWRLGDTHSMFWVCAVVLSLVILMVLNLAHSRYGRALRALGSSEIAADGLGVAVVQYKTIALALSAAITGIAGGLFAFFLRSFNSTAFGFSLSIELLIMVIVGSVRSIWGALIGATLITVLPNLLEQFEDYKLFVYGVAMVVIVMLMPEGLFQGLIEATQRLWAKRKPE